MVFIGDFFAIGLVVVLCIFYFERRHFLSLSSQIFAAALVLIGLTAVTNITCSILMSTSGTPLWALMLSNSLYFVFSASTLFCFTTFLLLKITEHSYNTNFLYYGILCALSMSLVFGFVILTNLKTGDLFYFDADFNYCRGPLNSLGYYLAIAEIALVIFTYLHHRSTSSGPMRRLLLQTIPCAFLCIVLQRAYEDIMIVTFCMALFALVLYLNFQGRRQGVHDLTHLNDHTRFFQEVESRFALKQKFQVFFIELTDFTDVSQRYTHRLGDDILYHFAYELKHLIPKSTAFHLERSSFAVIIPGAKPELCLQRLTLLQSFLKRGLTFTGELIRLDSMLVEYVVNEHDDTPREFFEQLDYAIHAARRDHTPYIHYTPAIGQQMQRRQYLLDRIKTVDEEHGFEVWLQPIYSLRTQCLCSAEALLRLRDDDGKLISPAEFIPLAEESDTIYDITWFVMEQVCRFLHNNPKLDFISVSVNLPMPQLQIPGFLQRLNSITKKYDIEHRRLCLEITERTFLEDYDLARDCMQALCSEGYRMFLDDFGVGYSNFNCLLQLPFSCIKLDSSISQDIETDDHRRSTIRSLIRLFQERGNHVIAEGAETESQVQYLADCGVDRIQGYYYAKPMDMGYFLNFYDQLYQPNQR